MHAYSDSAPSRSPSPPPAHERERSRRRAGGAGDDYAEKSPAERERQLAEQLRRRAMASKSGGANGTRTAGSPSTPPRPRSPDARHSSSRRREQRRGRSSSRSMSRTPPPRSRSRSYDSRSSTRSRSKDSSYYRRRNRRRGLDAEDGKEGGDELLTKPCARRSSTMRSTWGDEQDDAASSTAAGAEASGRRRGRGSEYDRRSSHHGGSPSAAAPPPPRGENRYYGRDHDRSRGGQYGYDRGYDDYYAYGGGAGYYDRGYPPRSDYPDDRRGGGGGRHRYPSGRRTPSPGGAPPRSRRRSQSPPARPPVDATDIEERSVFCSQLAARLTQRDLGEFFEENLGENTVKDVRIVMDKITRRSKGVGYVELADRQLLPKALGLSGQPLFGIPILIQLTDAARNRNPNDRDTQYRPNLVNAVETAVGTGAESCAYNASGLSSATRAANANPAARLYVGSLHFELTSENVKEVFEPFGEIEYVDLHREPGSGKSKGFCFVQYKDASAAEQALAHMDGMDLFGRAIKVGHVNSRGGPSSGPAAPTGSSSTGANMTALGGAMAAASNLSSFNNAGGGGGGGGVGPDGGGQMPTGLSAFDEGGGGGLNPITRAALMEKLMRTGDDISAASAPVAPAEQFRPANIPQARTTTVLLQNMFNPAEETERDWDKELASDVKEECENKYGGVAQIFVQRESLGDIYVKYADVNAAEKAVEGLNGRFFGGRSIKASFISEAIFQAATKSG